MEDLQRELAELAKHFESIEGQIAQLQEGMMEMELTRWLKRKGCYKLKILRTWAVLPDEAVYQTTWDEFKDKQSVDRIIQVSSVDFLLLQKFHGFTDRKRLDSAALAGVAPPTAEGTTLGKLLLRSFTDGGVDDGEDNGADGRALDYFRLTV